MSINRKEIEEIAILAKLHIAEEEKPQLVESLNSVMQLIEQINAVSTEHVKPMCHPLDAVQIVRKDEVTDSSHKEQLLALATHADEDHYLVPKVIE